VWIVENQIVVHIKSDGLKIAIEAPDSLTSLKIICDQGSEIYLNGSEVSDITDKERTKGIGHPLARNYPNHKSVGSTILETQVINIIYQLGIPANIKGYGYLREAIILVVNNPDIIYALTKELYPAVAHIFDTTASRVERGIRHAITVAWQRMDSGIMKEFFGYRMSFSMTKPTNSEFIATISDRLLLRMNDV
jgi:two-component system response regulator (stage 0 sporulation protein A)